MCGRYTLTASIRELMAEFEFAEAVDLRPRYNVAPLQFMPIIRGAETAAAPPVAGGDPHAAVRQVALMRWGLVPSWAKDATSAARTINARSETAATQASFRAAFKRRRCLIPASGFFEWETVLGPSGKPVKRPHLIQRRDGGLMAFAGLWERWQPPDGAELLTFSILTTAASPFMQRLHTRMPIPLARTAYAEWLDPGQQDVARLRALLQPGADDLVEHVVSARVNSVRNDDAECLAAAVVERGLFDSP